MSCRRRGDGFYWRPRHPGMRQYACLIPLMLKNFNGKTEKHGGRNAIGRKRCLHAAEDYLDVKRFLIRYSYLHRVLLLVIYLVSGLIRVCKRLFFTLKTRRWAQLCFRVLIRGFFPNCTLFPKRNAG